MKKCKLHWVPWKVNEPHSFISIKCVCVYSNSRNDIPKVARRYGTIATHTRRRASVLIVFVVFCVHMHSFAGLIRRMPPPTFSDTAITDRHCDTTIFQLRAHWARISWSIGSEKLFGHVPPVGVKQSNPWKKHSYIALRLKQYFLSTGEQCQWRHDVADAQSDWRQPWFILMSLMSHGSMLLLEYKLHYVPVIYYGAFQ